MTKRGLTILIVAVLAVGGGAAVIAVSVGGSSDTPAVHTMGNGQMMQGSGMSGGSTGGPGAMATTQHSMADGRTMKGSGGGSTEDTGMSK